MTVWARAALFAAVVVAALQVRADAHAAPPPGDLTAWSVAESASFRYHVQPAADGSLPLDAPTFSTAYAPDAEQAMTELRLLLGATPPDKVNVYLYVDAAQHDAAVTAIARPERAGVRAAADPVAGDITIHLPTFQQLSPVQAENALRHALSHVLTAAASGGKVPQGFDEGIAQYVERPVNEQLARVASLVQAADQQGSLPSWFDMNRDLTGVDADLVAAQTYSVIAFLVDRFDLPPLQRFLADLRTAPTWRDALRSAYGRDPNALEQQWREDLPRWTSTGWRENVVSAFDLDPARALLAQANYAAAKATLEPSQELYRQLNDPTTLAEVDALVTQADTGIQAEALMTQAQQALELHTYERAASLVVQARSQYDVLPVEQRPEEMLATYERLASQGMEAELRLETAQELADSWGDYPEARRAARDAGAAFAALGDQDNYDRAAQVLDDLDGRQRRIVLALAGLAVLTLAWLGLWLWARGPSQLVWREVRWRPARRPRPRSSGNASATRARRGRGSTRARSARASGGPSARPTCPRASGSGGPPGCRGGSARTCQPRRCRSRPRPSRRPALPATTSPATCAASSGGSGSSAPSCS